MGVEFFFGEVSNGLEERHSDLHANDGSGLQQALLFRRQAIDACRQHCLDRLRHHQRRVLPPVFHDVPGQLFQKEGISCRFRQDLLDQRLWDCCGPEHRLHHRPTVTSPQWRQRDLGGV